MVGYTIFESVLVTVKIIYNYMNNLHKMVMFWNTSIQ